MLIIHKRRSRHDDMNQEEIPGGCIGVRGVHGVSSVLVSNYENIAFAKNFANCLSNRPPIYVAYLLNDKQPQKREQ